MNPGMYDQSQLAQIAQLMQVSLDPEQIARLKKEVDAQDGQEKAADGHENKDSDQVLKDGADKDAQKSPKKEFEGQDLLNTEQLSREENLQLIQRLVDNQNQQKQLKGLLEDSSNLQQLYNENPQQLIEILQHL